MEDLIDVRRLTCHPEVVLYKTIWMETRGFVDAFDIRSLACSSSRRNQESVQTYSGYSVCRFHFQRRLWQAIAADHQQG